MFWNRTETLMERKIMKLMRYERPGLAWPGFGRLTDFRDELERMFESPLTAWSTALDVREDRDNFVIRAELPGLRREGIDVSVQDGAIVSSGEGKVGKTQEGSAL